MAPIFYTDIENAVNIIRERNTYSTECLDAVKLAIDIFTHYSNAEEYIGTALEVKRSSFSSVKKQLISIKHYAGSKASLMNAKSVLTKLVEHYPESIKAGVEVLGAIPNESESIQRINKKLGGVANPRGHIRGRRTFELLANRSVDEIKSAIQVMEQALEELSPKNH